MTLEQYIDTYGLDMDELALCLLRRIGHLDDIRRQELVRALVPEAKSAAQENMLNLVEEASQNLRAAKALRESVVDGGQIVGSVQDVQRALLAADRCLETSSKRFQDVYNVTSQLAIETAVKETMEEMPEEVYQRFIDRLESKLKHIR
jgi:hypothetical protein